MSGRSMYMHTLKGQPASFAFLSNGDGYIHFVGGRNRVTLVPSLRLIRQQQRWAIEAIERSGPNQAEWADPKLYGYVLVDRRFVSRGGAA